MRIKLDSIELKNFKGVQDFYAAFEGKSATIKGKNGAGKTTIADAFLWIMDDLDSNQQSRFNIITLDESGAAINNQEAIVEVVLLIDDQKITLKKVYRQKWTKKRGLPTTEMTGNTTDYFFNHTPVSKTNYFQKLNEIIQIENLRLLCDVNFFANRLHVDKRRNILMQFCKNVITPGSSELARLLNGRTIDEARKMLLMERKKINASLESIPIRIDELRKIKPKTSGDKNTLVIEASTIENAIELKIQEIQAIKNGEMISSYRIQAAELIPIVDENIAIKEQELSKINDDWQNILQKIGTIEFDSKTLSETEKILRKDWFELDQKTLEIKDTCFACGQLIPEASIKNQIDEFDKKKKSELTEIERHARLIIAELKSKSEEIDDLNDKVRPLELKYGLVKNEIEKIKSENVAKNATIAKRRLEIEEKIKNMADNLNNEIAPLESDIECLKREHAQIMEQIAKFDQIENINHRIDSYQSELKLFGSQFEDIERKINMLEDHVREISRNIEQSVNANFAITEWKLFENQINGGIKDICEATRDGVPYSDMNTGGKINVGLDCINALQKMHDINMPVFIDNSESITDWMIDIDCQMIRLIAMPNVEKLEVITE